jgi:predicted LPLAT superfamily acyltransferase
MSTEQTEHWAEQPELGKTSGLWIMYAVYATLGRWAFALLLYPVAAYFYLTARGPRRASQAYLARVRQRLHELEQPPRATRSSFGHFLDFGYCILDKGATWAARLPPPCIEIDNPPLFERLRDSRQGALFIVSHLGNLEVLRARAQVDRGIAINALVSTRNSPNLNKLILSINPSASERLVEIDTLGPESIMRLQDRIHAGEHVAVAADRVSVRHRERSMHAPFLGVPAPFPEGPFVLAGLLACPVYLLFCLRIDGRYRVFIEPFADPLALPRRTRRRALELAIARYAQRLEAHCLLAPTQWFNFFDFWGQADSGPKIQ